MNKLDEIEDGFRNLDNDLTDEEVDLLFRTVRQQNAVIRAAMHAFDTDDWNMYSAMSRELDPDVLELLRE